MKAYWLMHMRSKRSISRDMTVALISTVVTVSIAIGSFFYVYVSQKAKAQLEKEADEYLISLAGVLDVPLWDMDERTVKRIGQAYARDELVEKLRITDHTGSAYFDFKRESKAPLVSRASQVLHEGQPVGFVEISLTAKHYQENNRQLLLFGIGTLSVVILVLVIATGLILRMLLNKPLDCLGEIVKAYASGRYDAPEQEMPFVEFQPFVHVLAEMGNKITTQMTELRNAEIKYRSIVENAVEGIFQSTPDGRFLSANPSMARTLGYNSVAELMEDIGNIKQQLYVVPAQREEFIQLMRQGKTVSGFYVQLYRKDKNIVWASIHARPVFDADGTLLFAEGILEDITDHKRAEEEKKKLEAQLVQAQKMEAIGTLAGGIAHDFNNILSAILGFTELTLNSTPEGSEEHDNLQQILQAGERAKDLVKQILAFSRKSGQERKPLQIASIVKEAIKLLRATIPTTIEIKQDITSSQAKVLADASQMHQVIINLCTNSAYAMREQGGTLEVKLEEKYLDKERLSSYPDLSPGPFVILTVGDTGHGINPELLDRIFDPFFTTKEVDEGTGMGLAVVYGIVKAHGGGIKVYSQPGLGTTFTVLLPEVAGEDAGVEEVLPPIPRGRGRLLVVDDEEILVNLMKKILSKLGYEVTASNSSLEALKIFQAQPGKFDLVITDHTMPAMTGMQLAQELRGIRPDIPIILCTGFSETVSKEKVKAAGINKLFMKPIIMRSLAEAVRQVVEKN